MKFARHDLKNNNWEKDNKTHNFIRDDKLKVWWTKCHDYNLATFLCKTIDTISNQNQNILISSKYFWNKAF